MIIATEYVAITSAWIARKQLDAEVLHVSGSTEVFPPDDADMIVDKYCFVVFFFFLFSFLLCFSCSTATGTTLEANRLKIVDVLCSSSTHLCVHRSVLDNPLQMAMVEKIILLLKRFENKERNSLFKFLHVAVLWKLKTRSFLSSTFLLKRCKTL